VSQIVNPDIIQFGCGANPFPARLQIGHVGAISLARQEIWIASDLRNGLDRPHSGHAKMDNL